MATYYILKKSNIKIYVNSTKVLKEYFLNENIQITEIGDGNMNFVFLLKSKSKSLILKQSVPYLRCLGEDFILNRSRINFEIDSLKIFEALNLGMSPKIIYSSKNIGNILSFSFDFPLFFAEFVIKPINSLENDSEILGFIPILIGALLLVKKA